MKASDLYEHFRTRGTWVDWNHTTDRFTSGDPSRSVRAKLIVEELELAESPEQVERL